MIDNSEKFANGSSSKSALEAYVPIYEAKNVKTNIALGNNTSSILLSDPKLTLFTLSKYKFAGKILSGAPRVRCLEVGCMDGFGSLFLSKFVDDLVAVDFYRPHLLEANQHIKPHLENVVFKELDFLDSEYNEEFDGVVCFDVLEHVDPAQSKNFVENLKKALKPRGTLVLGMPSKESQIYASAENKRSHINCMTRQEGVLHLQPYFQNIFCFSMNDEVVHTGFDQMAHYHIYVCVN